MSNPEAPRKRFNYVFAHMSRMVAMHCCEDEQDAKEAFQRRYGYWPENAICSEAY